jgi:uncharacterized phage-associated protein
MRSALEVANWFISASQKADVTLDRLKLHQLLYIAFGMHVADHCEHLFYDPIEAHKWGPIVPIVQARLEWVVSDRIIEPLKSIDWKKTPQIDKRDKHVEQSLVEVFEEFGYKTPSQLSGITHDRAGPWGLAFYGKRSKVGEIDKQRIFRYFLEKTEQRPILKAVGSRRIKIA